MTCWVLEKIAHQEASIWIVKKKLGGMGVQATQINQVI